jgi:ANTAR domain
MIRTPGSCLSDDGPPHPGETHVAVPLVSREQLVGVIILRHYRPRRYSLRDVKLLSCVGFFLGAEIGIARLESRNSELSRQLEARKVLERGKGILQRDLGLSEEQAYLALQRQSRQKRKSMKDIAQSVVFRDALKRKTPTNSAEDLPFRRKSADERHHGRASHPAAAKADDFQRGLSSNLARFATLPTMVLDRRNSLVWKKRG